MSYVIIGNSTAAIGAVEGIRKYDQTTKITIVSDEAYTTYSRPLISYYLGGKVSEENIRYRDESFYEFNKVDKLLGIKVMSVDFPNKVVKLENGNDLPYSKLLIATGSKPFIPTIDGLDKENIFNFIKFDDVKSIEKVAKKGSKAVVVGASFSGLKAVESLVYRGVDITVIDIMDRIMPRVLDRKASGIVEKVLKNHGVTVLLNNAVEKISGSNKVDGVILKDGTKIDCDFIIMAIGVRCNTDIVKETALEMNRGIAIDDKMKTNIPDVFAAGDVAEGYNFIEKRNMEIPILPNAYYQGETAGSNMAGAGISYKEGFIMNSLPLFDLPIISAGISEDRDYLEIKTIENDQNDVYKKFYFEDNKLVGFLLINDVDRAGIYTDLIRSSENVEDIKNFIGDNSFGFAHLPLEIRKEKLQKGGELI
ncbi:MAG: FAD-dependent oxidoreductase [Clostridia bacterium]|nr:FAD-dependent oxidoreductase [Clostridia bacterium]